MTDTPPPPPPAPDTPAKREPDNNLNGCAVSLGVVVVIGLLLWGCSALVGGDDSGSGSASASANVACRHYRNVMSDLNAGLLTDAELRSKVQEVYDDANVADEQSIRTAARELLASATAGDPDRFNAARGRMGSACVAADAG